MAYELAEVCNKIGWADDSAAGCSYSMMFDGANFHPRWKRQYLLLFVMGPIAGQNNRD